jgi:hypothetical protein
MLLGTTKSGGTAKPLVPTHATTVKWNEESAHLLETFFEAWVATTFLSYCFDKIVHVEYSVAWDLVLNSMLG